MGCNTSKPDVSGASQLMELAPRIAGQEPPVPELDRATLLGALNNVALYLQSKGANITIVAVGGAVNTILLQSRATTHDVDFYNVALSQKEIALLRGAMAQAQKHDKTLSNEWLNNRTVLFIPKAQRKILTDEAMQQRDVVFGQPGLTVLAAPWKYAFCAKLDRLAGTALGGSRPYDLSDAASYLHQHLQKYRLGSVQRTQVEAWARGYQTSVTPSLLDAVNTNSQTKFGFAPIDMDN